MYLTRQLRRKTRSGGEAIRNHLSPFLFRSECLTFWITLIVARSVLREHGQSPLNASGLYLLYLPTYPEVSHASEILPFEKQT